MRNSNDKSLGNGVWYQIVNNELVLKFDTSIREPSCEEWFSGKEAKKKLENLIAETEKDLIDMKQLLASLNLKRKI